MPRARITLDRDFTIGEVPRRLFGSFVEHMGRCVYSGIYEPDHPSADESGFRRDVLALVTEMGPTVVRYPGGNFVSGYNWEDGTGPVAERPRRLDGAWHSVESNAFGLHEFVEWSKLAGVEIMEAINLGTRGVDAARELVEYANHPGGTALSDRRIANGARDPFDIKLWCLGNELDGPWQIGHKTADEYGRLAQEAAKAMRFVDPSIELVAVGSSGRWMSTFGEWERIVLGHAYSEVDYVSMHAYYQEHDGDAASFLGSAVDMDGFIDDVVSTIDHAKAAGKHRKDVHISFDEWNVWTMSDATRDDHPESVGARWRERPRLIEDEYTVTDAVVVGTYLNSLLRHGDRVRIANQAQLVNVIAPIRSEEGGAAWRQTSFWPFARVSELASGQILRAAVDSDRIETSKYDGVDAVDVSATWDEASGRAAVFLANRSLDEPATIEVALRGFADARVTAAEVLTVPEGGTRHTSNTELAQPVGLVPLENAAVSDGILHATLPALSWAAIRLTLTRE